MQTTHKLLGDLLSIKIDGHITGITEVTKLKDIFNSNASAKIIEMQVIDAYVIPSMLIGLFLKEVNVNNRKLRLICSQKELKTLINDLNLNSVIEVR